MTALLRRMCPASCTLCQDEIRGGYPGAVCDICRAHFLSHTPARCYRCAIALHDTGARECGACLKSPPAFDATVVACDYAAPADLLVQALKFRARLPLADTLADLMARALYARRNGSLGLIIPVPLSDARLAERGFNQSAEIARALSRRTGIPLRTDLCIRVRDTRPQAGLPFRDRQVNMRGAFAVRLDARTLQRLQHQHVLLVDDVMTTGHTLNALAACLKRQGAATVTNAVFARTPRK